MMTWHAQMMQRNSADAVALVKSMLCCLCNYTVLRQLHKSLLVLLLPQPVQSAVAGSLQCTTVCEQVTSMS